MQELHDYDYAVACLCFICGTTHARETDLSWMLFLTFEFEHIDPLIRVAARLAGYPEEAKALRLLLHLEHATWTKDPSSQLVLNRSLNLWKIILEFARGELLPR